MPSSSSSSQSSPLIVDSAPTRHWRASQLEYRAIALVTTPRSPTHAWTLDSRRRHGRKLSPESGEYAVQSPEKATRRKDRGRRFACGLDLERLCCSATSTSRFRRRAASTCTAINGAVRSAGQQSLHRRYDLGSRPSIMLRDLLVHADGYIMLSFSSQPA